MVALKGTGARFLALPVIMSCLMHICPAAAETFRVHDVILLDIDSSGEKTTVSAGINDAVLIALPEDLTFVEGIELVFKVPQEVAAWRDSVAWSLYEALSPQPAAGQIDYSGTRSTVGTFGSSLSLNMQIPLYRENTIKKNAYSQYIAQVPDTTGGAIFLRLQLAMKGTGEEVYAARFEISGKPLFIDKGILILETSAPGGGAVQPYTVFVDGMAAEPADGELLLSPGSHDLSIVSDFYRNETRTVTIEQAKRTRIGIAFRAITPLVRLAVPEGTVVYLDDVLLEVASEPIPVTQGDHQLKFKVGDYELVKTISAVNGRTYTVSVNVDAHILEEE